MVGHLLSPSPHFTHFTIVLVPCFPLEHFFHLKPYQRLIEGTNNLFYVPVRKSGVQKHRAGPTPRIINTIEEHG